MAKDEKELTQAEVIATAVATALAQVIPALRPDPDALIRAQADAIKLAKEETRETAHSNPTSPEVSAFNPLGERAHPRPVLKCKFTINEGIELGTPTDNELLDIEECDLLNAVPPGDYQIEKMTGEAMRFQVVAHTDEWGKVNRVNLTFKCNEDDDKIGLPSLKSMLRQTLARADRASAAKILTMTDWRELASEPTRTAVA